MRTAVTAVLVLAVALTIGAVVAVHEIGERLTLRLPNLHDCQVGSGPSEIPLDPDQLADAATVAAVGIRQGVPEHGIMIALAAAWQESKLRNLPEGDRDSLGLFQQRPSQGWGTADQIADPRYAAHAFYHALLKIKGWQTMRVTDAAQAVQRSGHPEAYEKWQDKAEELTQALIGTTTGTVTCTISKEPSRRGPAAAAALADALRQDWGDHARPATTDLPGLSLTVAGVQAGWQYAHWLVAHAADQGVKRVRFAGREWTAKGGAWTTVTGAPADAGLVVAEVYGDG